MDTKKLRQKILDLAIHGKLVPQDPNDEPASVLLERIRAEKERLIKEGKIKQSKKSAKSSDTRHYENIDFALPENWQLSTLGEVFYMHAGKNIVASEISSNTDETYRYKCIGGNGLRGYVQQFNTEGSFPIIGRQGALCGNINYVEGRFYATEHAVVVDTFCETNLKWAFYFLIQLNLNQYATATAQPGLSVNTISDVQIPIPPKEEQCRIVSYIEQCFRTIDSLERGKDELEENIKKTKSKILDLAIHGKLVPQDPNDEPAIELLKRINPSFVPCDNGHDANQLPDSWCWTTLGKVGKWQSGTTPSRLNKEYYGGDIPWLKAGDLNDGYIYDIPETITQKALEETSVKLNPAGSVLIAMYGATIGKVGILTCPATTNQACCACVEYNGIEQMYLFYFLLSHREEFIMLGGGGAQPNISKEKIIETLFPLPPYTEQLRIVTKIEELFAVLDEIQKSIEV
jgi:type I restriction enzyme S subunit